MLLAPAKINLHLGVYSKKNERGYHLVQNLMVPISLYDAVDVFVADDLVVEHTPVLSISSRETTVYKAADLLAKKLGRRPNIRICVHVKIPERAGLGGSSADAGGALRALAALWNLDVKDPIVTSTAQQIGADVAFFLDPRPSLFEGVGDVCTAVFDCPEIPLVLVMPNQTGPLTSQVYHAFDTEPTDPRPVDELCKALNAAPKAQDIAPLLFNNLENAACTLYPPTREVLMWLRTSTSVYAAQLSGSGTCSFGLCASIHDAKGLADEARERGWRAWAATTISC